MGSNCKLFGFKLLKKLVKKLVPEKGQDQPLQTHPPTQSNANSSVLMEDLPTDPPISANSSVLMEDLPTDPPISENSSVLMEKFIHPSTAAPISSNSHDLIPCVLSPNRQDFKEQVKVNKPPGRDTSRILLHVSKDENGCDNNISNMDVAMWCYKLFGLDGMDESLGKVKNRVPYGAKFPRDVGVFIESERGGNMMKIGWFAHNIVCV